MSGSRTIIDKEDLLDNVHPGDILREDFLIGSDIPFEEVVIGAGIEIEVLKQLVASKIDVDANIDIRLARYFGMSEGFFLGLQIDYDLEEERRAHGAELAQINRRAG
jgi:addiction module HigA family antidote